MRGMSPLLSLSHVTSFLLTVFILSLDRFAIGIVLTSVLQLLVLLLLPNIEIYGRSLNEL